MAVKKIEIPKQIGRLPVTPPKDFYTIKSLAAKEKVHYKTVYYWIITGKIEVTKADGVWLIPKKTFKRPPNLVELHKLNRAKIKAKASKKGPRKPSKKAPKKTPAAVPVVTHVISF